MIRVVNTAGTLSTFAGTGVDGSAGDNGPATSAELRSPAALAFDAQGNLYVADAADNRVRRISPAGIITTVAGTGSAGFSGDSGPAIAAGLSAPGGIAVNASGTLFIADTGNNKVRRVTGDGLISTVAGAGTAANPAVPSAYLTPLSGPTDVAVDGSGNVLVADSGNFVIRRIDGDGAISTIAGGGTQGSSGTDCPALLAQFNAPLHLAADASGHLVVSDTSNQRIRIIDANCYINDAAGTGAAGFSGDGGSALQGELNTNSGVTVDQAGNIFIADSANQRIRKLAASPAIPSISFQPAAARSGGRVTGYIDLGSPAATSAVVQLSSSTPLVGLPGTMTIPAGQTTGVFTFTAPTVTAQTPVTVAATGPGLNTAATIADSPATDSSTSGTGVGSGTATLGSLTLGSTSVVIGDSTAGTVMLTQPAPAGGLSVMLTSDNPAATVAASVTVPAGQTSAQFLVSTADAASPPTAATLTATGAGSSFSAGMNILAPEPAALNAVPVAGIMIPGSAVVGGQSTVGTVILASPAPAGGAYVGLGSTSPSLIVPAVVTVPAGSVTAGFPINTMPVASPVAAGITATSANTVSAPVSVNPPSGQLGTAAQVSLNPSTITGGESSIGTVTLASPAGPNGVSVSLASSVPGVTVPAMIMVSPGTTTATFRVNTTPVTAPVTGSMGATSANSVATPVTINPASTSGAAGTVASLSVDPPAISGGQTATGTVTLASPAPAGGITVGLSSSIPSLTVPATVSVPQGAVSTNFPIIASPVTAAVSGNITATSANAVTTPVTVNPSANTGTTGQVASLSVNPPMIGGGQSGEGTVTLANPAAVGGVTVSLSSSIPSVMVPASVTVSQGSTVAKFPIITAPVSTAASGNITATSANSVSAPVTVSPTAATATVATLSISPQTIIGGQTATGTVSLASPAGTGGVSVGLASSTPSVAVPAMVTVAQGSTAATFPVTTSPVTTPVSGMITATSANAVTTPVTVNPSGNGGTTGTIATLSVSPQTISGGQTATGTVSLASPAGVGGVSVGLASSTPSVTVPATVTVAQGSTSATFPITTSSVTTPVSGTITATSANAISTSVTVNPSGNGGTTGTISTLSISPQTISGGQTATGTEVSPARPVRAVFLSD